LEENILQQLANINKKITTGQSTFFSTPEMRNMPERMLGMTPSQETIERRLTERLQEGVRRIESGGSFKQSELPLAGQVFHELSSRKETLQTSMERERELHQAMISKRVQDIVAQRQASKGGSLTQDEMSKIKLLETEKTAPQLEAITSRFNPQIKMLEEQIKRTSPRGMRFDPESLRLLPGGGGVAAGIAGMAKDVSMEDLQKELSETKMTISKRGLSGSPQVRRSELGPMMSQILKNVESERGTTLEKDKIKIQEQLIKKTEDFISKNKESANQLDKFNKEFGKMDENFDSGTRAQNKFKESMKDLGSSAIAVSRITSGMVSSIGAMSRGDMAGIFSGATTSMLGIGRLGGTMGRLGGRIGGMFGSGGIGRFLGGGLGIIGGMAGATLGTIGAIGTLGINAAQRQFRDAASFEQAAYRMGLSTGETGLPSFQGVQDLSFQALRGGMTLPQYSQVALQAQGRALLTPQQSRAMMQEETIRGNTPIAEMARFAEAFGRPVQELAGQVGMVARATGGNFQNIMETMTRMGDVRGMQGSLFTGEMQNAFSRLADTLMKSLGGLRGNLREGALENLISPMISAGVTPNQAAGVAGSFQQYVTGAIFQPQQRLLLEAFGVSQQAIERGKGPGGTAAEELMKGLGISGEDLLNAKKTGEIPGAFRRVQEITGIQNTEKAFTSLTRYIMGFSSELSNSVIETVKNIESTAKLKKELDELGKTYGTQSDIYKQKQKELNESTEKVTEGNKRYNDIIRGGQFLLSFKEKTLEATGKFVSAMQGMMSRGRIPEIMKQIENSFQPIMAIAADAITPALDLLKNVLVSFGNSADNIRKKLNNIDTESITKRLTSGEFFQDLGKSASEGVTNILVEAGTQIMTLIRNKLLDEHPEIAKILGIERDYSKEGLLKHFGLKDFSEESTGKIKDEEKNIYLKKPGNLWDEASRGNMRIQDAVNQINESYNIKPQSPSGKPEGDSERTDKKPETHVHVTINQNGEKKIDKTMVANDGNSFSINQDFKRIIIF